VRDRRAGQDRDVRRRWSGSSASPTDSIDTASRTCTTTCWSARARRARATCSTVARSSRTSWRPTPSIARRCVTSSPSARRGRRGDRSKASSTSSVSTRATERSGAVTTQDAARSCTGDASETRSSDGATTSRRFESPGVIDAPSRHRTATLDEHGFGARSRAVVTSRDVTSGHRLGQRGAFRQSPIAVARGRPALSGVARSRGAREPSIGVARRA
jgi:hypothetical protein